jgi:hypothetical protein
VLDALAVGAPKSVEELLAVPSKRRALLAMLPAIRQRHRFHLQVCYCGSATEYARSTAVSMSHCFLLHGQGLPFLPQSRIELELGA